MRLPFSNWQRQRTADTFGHTHCKCNTESKQQIYKVLVENLTQNNVIHRTLTMLLATIRRAGGGGGGGDTIEYIIMNLFRQYPPNENQQALRTQVPTYHIDHVHLVRERPALTGFQYFYAFSYASTTDN